MAAEVGLALLTPFLDVLFDRLASAELVNFVKGKKLDQRLLQNFEDTLNAVGALLNDAEQKQIKSPSVKRWLDAFKDAVYKADDLLDEISTRATEKKVRKFFNLNFKGRKIGSKTQEIIQRLEEIRKHSKILGLKNIAGQMLTHRPKSTSPVVESDVCGREKDKEAIIAFLLSDDTSDGKKIRVIPIVGLGGIGKTTLAQLVYNDDRVKQKFDLQAWVCVSDDFDVSRIMRNIMEDISDGTCKIENSNSLQIELQKRLEGKIFLIVLDDVWDKTSTDWEHLKTLFRHGHEGSKIIVTSRSAEAVPLDNIAPFYPLEELSDDDCWSIFGRHASLSEPSIPDPILKEVRPKITTKCKGLPIAAKILAGLLRKSDVKSWKTVLKSGMWDSSEYENMGVPALRVSYYFLPPNLKRCFIHCSLYPKDFHFDKKEVILLWMAEGLLQPRNRNMSLEEVGYAYFEDLTSRFFFQRSNSGPEAFVMHDLIHDLAEYFAGEFYRRVEIDERNNICNTTRHISYLNNDYCDDLEVSMFKAIKNSEALRTFLNLSVPWSSMLNKDFGRTLFSNCKCLRALSLHKIDFDGVLPNSIGDLIHLRYLDLSYTDIISLPDSICKLHNLQTLKLRRCAELTKLPHDLQDLVNLRHLDVRKTKIREMPKGMGKLKNMHYLSDFIVGKDKGRKIGELGALPDLAHDLRIWQLQNVGNKEELSQGTQMIGREHIEKIKLHWETQHVIDSQTEEDILEKLEPHTNLEDLSISGYMGTKFSYWLGEHRYRNMKDITLSDCKNCLSLPPLGQLPKLKTLSVREFWRLEIIDDGFYKRSDSSLSVAFPSLEYLSFRDMRAWKEWYSFENDTFPLLRHLVLYDCPKIVRDLPKHLPVLENLEINFCRQLASHLPRAPLIRHLKIGEFEELILQPEEKPLPLKELEILACVKQEFLMQICCEHLQSLSFNGCENLKFVLVDRFPNLQTLVIFGCENLKYVSVSLAWLQRLRDVCIYFCPNLEDIQIKGNPPHNMIPWDVHYCPKLKSSPICNIPR